MDINELFTPRVPEEDVEIAGVGTVRVRALNRLEALKVQDAGGVEATERLILVLGMVDPRMTDADVRRWMEFSPAGEIEAVSRRIAILSGMAEESAKEAVRDFEANPDHEFRVLPSGEAGDDSGSAPGGNAG